MDNFITYRKSTGELAWIATYSNNARDDDMPVREIISGDSHKRYVKLVNSGLLPLPELWIWHIKALKIGEAEWVSYDERNGIVFALAGGRIYQGVHEQVALDAIKSFGDVALSHGYNKDRPVKRDPVDPTIIVEHETHEISILPRKAAANKHTIFAIAVKGNKMDETELKRITEFVGEDALKGLLQANDATAGAIQAEQRQTKEIGGVVVEEVSQDEIEVALVETVAEETQEPVAQEQAPTAVDQLLVTLNEFKSLLDSQAAELKQIREELASKHEVVELAKSILARFDQQDQAIADTVKAVDKVKNMADTPIASLAALISQNKSSAQGSTPESGGETVIGRTETRVDERTSLGKSKPAMIQPSGDTPGTGLFFQSWLKN